MGIIFQMVIEIAHVAVFHEDIEMIGTVHDFEHFNDMVGFDIFELFHDFDFILE